MRILVTPDTDFSNISWNWLCYQRAFSAIYQNYFWKLSLFAGTIVLQIWLYTHMPSLIGIVKKNKNEKLRIVQSVALGVCFSIYYDWTITDQIEFWKLIFRVLYYWSYLKFTLFHRQPRDWFRISNNRVIDFVYQNYTLMNTDEHWRHMFCANVYLPTKSWNVQPRKWWDKKCTGYVGGFIFQTGDLYS